MNWALLVGMPWGDPVVDVASRNGGTVFRCGCTEIDQCAGFEHDLREFQLVVTVAWRHLVPRRVLERSTVIGFHSAKLPEYPGRAPVPWTLVRGDEFAFNTMLYLDEGVDSGDIIAERRLRLLGGETPATLNDWMARSASEMLQRHLPGLLDGSAPRQAQDQSKRGRPTRKDGWQAWYELQRMQQGHA